MSETQLSKQLQELDDEFKTQHSKTDLSLDTMSETLELSRTNSMTLFQRYGLHAVH
jgi:hypothetical protein